MQVQQTGRSRSRELLIERKLREPVNHPRLHRNKSGNTKLTEMAGSLNRAIAHAKRKRRSIHCYTERRVAWTRRPDCPHSASQTRTRFVARSRRVKARTAERRKAADLAERARGQGARGATVTCNRPVFLLGFSLDDSALAASSRSAYIKLDCRTHHSTTKTQRPKEILALVSSRR